MVQMKFVRQPTGSNQCGQACVAMLGDISLEDACIMMRTEGSTRTRDVITALDALGIKHGDKRVRGEPSGTAMLYYQSKDRSKAHWVLYHKKKWRDPAAGVFRKLPRHLAEADLTSYLQVEL